MKRIAITVFLLFMFTLPAFAFFSSGNVDGCPGVKFENLKVDHRTGAVRVTLRFLEMPQGEQFWGRITFINAMGTVQAKTYLINVKPNTSVTVESSLVTGKPRDANNAHAVRWIETYIKR